MKFPILFASIILTVSLQAAPLVCTGDRVVIAGDSITEQKLYTYYLECYLLACSGLNDIHVMQVGINGDSAPGYAGRMAEDTLDWNPTLVLTCFGANDAGYRPYDDDIGRNFSSGIGNIARTLKDRNIRMALGSSVTVEENYRNINPGRPPAEIYNQSLTKLAEITRDTATKYDGTFADVHSIMRDTISRAHASLGDGYHVAGSDGLHPQLNGQLVMAYAFLKALGFDGGIARIEINLSGTTTATSGHRVVSQNGGTVELESTRYPFCFTPPDGSVFKTTFDPTKIREFPHPYIIPPDSPMSPRSILPFLPFQQDLNRFELVVHGLTSASAEVVWGVNKRTFTKEELEHGINLADVFPDNPFVPAFARLEAAVITKQTYETWITKCRPILIERFILEPGIREETAAFRRQALARQEKLQAAAWACVVPVRHTITVTPLK